MAWYDEAVFYHIYPLGLAGAPAENPYGEPEHRLNTLLPWISHIKEIGCNALYIGPLFESVGHGYETTDYKKLDSRLGTNEDLTAFVAECHDQGIRVILDGVFNHTGRDFFAFADIKKNRENSPYKDWYCNVNFWGNNQYNDGFSYENWGGYDLLVKLNQRNPAVRDYICDVIRFWAREFDIDGIRLDAADVLDFDYMHALRRVAEEVKPEFWLMGEVIHGDYTRWVNEGTLHSVTNYHLHKALYSGHNDHNYFEIAHTVKRLYGMGGNRPDGLKLYNFVDNHDVERIYTKLSNKAHFAPVHVLLYTLPGVPSIYYGSEFGIEGRKERFSDASLRPALSLSDYAGAAEQNPFTRLIAALGRIRQRTKALSYGDYQELLLLNRQYAFSRNYNGESVLVTVNNDDSDYVMTLPAGNTAEYIGALSGQKVSVNGGRIAVNVKANSGEIWLPYSENAENPAEKAAEANPAAFNAQDGAAPAPAPETKGGDGQAGTENHTAAEENTAPERYAAAENASAEKAGEDQPQEPCPAEKAAALIHAEGSAQAQDSGNTEGFAQAQGSGNTEGFAQVQAPVNASSPSQTLALENTKGSIQAQGSENTEDSIQAQDSEHTERSAQAQDSESTEHSAQAQNSANTAAYSYEEAFEKGKIAGLQEAILAIMEKNGPVTDQMRRDVMANVYHDSLVTWVKSFR